MESSTPNPDNEHLLRRAKLAFGTRDQWRGLLQEAYEYGLPMRNIWNSQSQGTGKMDRIFDSTLIISIQKFAARLQSELTPIGQKFLDFIPGPLVDVLLAGLGDKEQAAAEKKKMNATLQGAQKLFFGALDASNFDVAVAEFFMELSVGTAAMLFLEGDDNKFFNFEAVPIAQIGIDQGPFGAVDGVFREHEVEGRNIKRTWTDAKIPDDLAEKISKHPEDKISLIECTYYEPAIEKYAYKVIWKKKINSYKFSSELVTRNYDEHPWIITRWVKVAGETMGRGPVLFALPDVKTLNKVKEYVLKNAAIAISGIWSIVDDGVFNLNNIKIRPGAVMKVNKQGDLQRLESNARFDVASLIISDLQNTIRAILYDRALPSEAGAVRSPTEIIERVKQLQQDIGSPFGRLKVEFLIPLAQRGLNILARKGIIKPIMINGHSVDMVVNSPIARSQALAEIETIVRWAEVSKLSAGEESFFVSAKVEDIPGRIGEKLGVPVDLIRTQDERKEAMALMGQVAKAKAEGGIPVGNSNNNFQQAA